MFWSVDKAGNEETPHKSQQVKIDSTPPTLTWSAPSPGANASGWNNGPVQIGYTTADNLSGVASATPGSPVTFGSEGANQTQTVTVTDNAGNSAKYTSPQVNIDLTPPTVTASASPSTLWPPNGKMVSVVVSGKISDALSGVDPSSASFSVVDSYGAIQPSGSIAVKPDGSYAFTLQLEAKRNGSDMAGRRYAITVKVKDRAGNSGSAQTAVTVPHDQGK